MRFELPVIALTYQYQTFRYNLIKTLGVNWVLSSRANDRLEMTYDLLS